MERRIIELEEKIGELENKISKLEKCVLGICVDEKNDVYISEGTFPVFGIKAKGNIKIENSTIDALSFEGECQDATVITSNIHNLSVENSEQTDFSGCAIHNLDLDGYDSDDLLCQVDDIKCAAKDAKAILDDIEPRATAILEQLKNKKSEI